MHALPTPPGMPGIHPAYFDDLASATGCAAPHDLCARFEHRDARHAGSTATTIRYGRYDSAVIGPFTIAVRDNAICRIMLGDETACVAELRARWPGAKLSEDRAAASGYAERIRTYWNGSAQRLGDMPVQLQGTPFQLGVWHALLQIPMGTCVSYAAVARDMGGPAAVRAVGRAVAANPVALLIPCHRVVRAGGAIGGYAWGAALKQHLLATEAAVVAGWRGTA